MRPPALKTLALAIFALVLVGASGVVRAEIDNASGSVCKGSTLEDEALLEKSLNGIRNTSRTDFVRLICPMDRTAFGNTGAALGFAPDTNMLCMGQSRDWTGAVLASLVVPGAANVMNWINLNGAGNSTVLSHYVIYCRMPPGATLRHVVTRE